MSEKVTMVLKVVDLQCPCCYKKVKKILCKFPQIRDQVYDEKANTVTITVVCCNPEKIRNKLYCKGCKVIKCIEIKKPKKSDEPPKKSDEPPKTSEVPKKPKSPGTCTCTCTYTWTCTCTYTCTCPGTCNGACRGPSRTCCGSCYKGYGGGPCYHGYRVLPPPQPCYDEYYVYVHDQRGCSIM